MDSLLSRPGAEPIDAEPYGRYDDYSRPDGHDLITLLTWRFVTQPVTKGDPPPDRDVPERLRLSVEEVLLWHEVIGRHTPDDRPYVTRREIIDPRATQIRTLVVNSPFPLQGVHSAAILKKVKWGALIAQTILTVATAAHDPGGTVKRITDIYGTLDVAYDNLSHREAAVLTIAEQFKRAEWAHRWLWRCNELLDQWSPTVDIKMDAGDFLQTLFDLLNRGIEVEIPQDGERFPKTLSLNHGTVVFDDHKVLIRPVIALVNW